MLALGRKAGEALILRQGNATLQVTLLHAARFTTEAIVGIGPVGTSSDRWEALTPGEWVPFTVGDRAGRLRTYQPANDTGILRLAFDVPDDVLVDREEIYRDELRTGRRTYRGSIAS